MHCFKISKINMVVSPVKTKKIDFMMNEILMDQMVKKDAYF